MTQEGFKRKLTSIFSADAVGYSRLMGDDETATVRTLTSYRNVISSLIKQQNGTVIDSPGDNLLAEFVSVVDAVQCAVAVQKELKARNDELPENRRMQFRIGINLGDVIHEENRIYGDGVNIAARLEGLAEPGGICISKTIFDHIEGKLPYGYEFLGEQKVKNIAKPVGAFRVMLEPRVTVTGATKEKTSESQKRNKILFCGITVIVVVACLGIWQFYMLEPTSEPATEEKKLYPLPNKPAIAVLPFDNLNEERNQEYFVDGMTNDLITELSKLSGIVVIARNSSFTYKGKPVKVQQVAKDLSVQYILEGSVRRSGDQVRINAQLIDARTGHHLWAEKYDSTLDNVFDMQDKITQKVVAALAVKLRPDESKRLNLKETDIPEAYDSFLRGREYFNRWTGQDFAKAIKYFKKSIELDPAYGKAYATIADLYYEAGNNGWGPELGLTNIESCLIQSLKYYVLSKKHPTIESHRIASKLYLEVRQFEKANSEADQAINLNPNEPNNFIVKAQCLIFDGRPQESIKYIEKSMKLDPLHLTWDYRLLGTAEFLLGNFENAVRILEMALNLSPNDRSVLQYLAAAYGHLGDNQISRQILDRYLQELYGVSSLRYVILWEPFKKQTDGQLFAEGLIKAGMPGKLSDYPKLYEQFKLSGKEIQQLIQGRTLAGRDFYFPGIKWWIEQENDELSTLRTSFDSESGISSIEDDMFCVQWSKHWEGLKVCGSVFRNPDGMPELKNSYIWKVPFAINSFAIENK